MLDQNNIYSPHGLPQQSDKGMAGEQLARKLVFFNNFMIIVFPLSILYYFFIFSRSDFDEGMQFIFLGFLIFGIVAFLLLIYLIIFFIYSFKHYHKYSQQKSDKIYLKSVLLISLILIIIGLGAEFVDLNVDFINQANWGFVLAGSGIILLPIFKFNKFYKIFAILSLILIIFTLSASVYSYTQKEKEFNSWLIRKDLEDELPNTIPKTTKHFLIYSIELDKPFKIDGMLVWTISLINDNEYKLCDGLSCNEDKDYEILSSLNFKNLTFSPQNAYSIRFFNENFIFIKCLINNVLQCDQYIIEELK